MLVSEFDYHLPPDRIAQEPLPCRDSSRMLVVDRATGALHDSAFSELAGWLRSGDVLVINNSRVIRARLFGRRSGVRAVPVSPRNPSYSEHLTGRVEVLLTRQVDEITWQALVRPGRKIGIGETIMFSEELRAAVVESGQFGERTLQFNFSGDFFALLDRLGHVPLPPYIRHADRDSDSAAYQTVYARRPGSVAAPTAGLHFTPEVLEKLRKHGVEIAELTLHVGLGTFQPIHTEIVEQHRMHSERYEIPESTAAAVQGALAERRRVVAVGTTAARVLEHSLQAGAGETALFIYPGYSFNVAGALLTNFHLPRSTLLMLVCAFGGRELILRAYDHAVRHGGYRFYSYGDCMLVL